MVEINNNRVLLHTHHLNIQIADGRFHQDAFPCR